MVGVAAPMTRRNRQSGMLFIAFLASGYLLSAAIVALTLSLLADAVARSGLSEFAPIVAVGLALMVGVADATGRTLEWRRQVPERLVNRLSPHLLGVTWGLDLGAIITTRKTTGLIWFAMFGAAALQPRSAWFVPILYAATASAVVATKSVVALRSSGWSPIGPHGRRRRIAQLWSGIAILAWCTVAAGPAVAMVVS